MGGLNENGATVQYFVSGFMNWTEVSLTNLSVGGR